MDKEFTDSYLYTLSFVSPRIREYLKNISDKNLESIQEIRLRKGKPIVIVTQNGSSFLTSNSKLSYIFSTNCIVVSENEIIETLNKMCSYSVHSHLDTIAKGFVTLPNGSRVGVVGTAVLDGETIKAVKDISSINIRIPRTVYNISNLIFDNLFSSSIQNIIVFGPPNSGKTTMLKDIAFQLSTGKTGKYHKVCVVDERKEISMNDNKLGYNTDVLYGYPKSEGISIAVRTLSPDVVICDEVGNVEEIEQILQYVNTGVNFILTIHAKDLDELKRKTVFSKLVENGNFKTVVSLNSDKNPGLISDVYKVVVKNNDYIFNSLNHKLNCSNIFDRAN